MVATSSAEWRPPPGYDILTDARLGRATYAHLKKFIVASGRAPKRDLFIANTKFSLVTLAEKYDICLYPLLDQMGPYEPPAPKRPPTPPPAPAPAEVAPPAAAASRVVAPAPAAPAPAPILGAAAPGAAAAPPLKAADGGPVSQPHHQPDAHDEHTEDEYELCVRPHRAKIQELFEKLDADKSGELDTDELKAVVGLYQGEAYDEAEFMSWYDAHEEEGGGDGTISIKEFGWYLADCAECNPAKMAETLSNFEETVDYVASRAADDA